MARRSSRILDQLGIIGLTAVEPVLLSALAMEDPILLIGPHGTAKSLLLIRIAEALGLTFRHYNASLLNYDDLVGYPLPDEQGRLRFVETPASVWQAEAVFLDEISRCRPDMQNRLFSIVHERRVQGMPLERLKHRWAAMNPPLIVDGDTAHEHSDYAGSEPLDLALADRFPVVVRLPAWHELTESEQERVIESVHEPVPAEVSRKLRDRVALIQQRIAMVDRAYGAAVTTWTRLIGFRLLEMGLSFSGRRSVMLRRTALGVCAAMSAGEIPTAPELNAALFAALSASLPDHAVGRKIDSNRLRLAHREAWAAARLDRCDPRRVLLATHDPVERALLALEFVDLSETEFSAHIADGLAHARLGEREALALALVESDCGLRLIPAIAEQVAELASDLLAPPNIALGVCTGSRDHETAKAIIQLIATLPNDAPDHDCLRNLLQVRWAGGQLVEPEDVPVAAERFRTMRRRLQQAACESRGADHA